MRAAAALARCRGAARPRAALWPVAPRFSGPQLSVAQLPPSGAALTPSCPPQCDRFIPSRSAMDLNVARFNLSAESGEQDVKEVLSPTKVRHRCRTRPCAAGAALPPRY